ncbi:MAG: hypothetical protein RMM29_08780 [Planctomycetota bacterium]|nr:hypothetical protein [Planctomycetota bacterium]MDW8373721.1 hypothetical protein [Planctomycetota bacterium]
MAISLDYTNCLAEAIGATHGLTKSEVETLVAKFPKHHEGVEEIRASGECPFFDLPYQNTGEVQALIKKHRGAWSDLLIIATGGEAEALRALHGALSHAAHNLVEPKARREAPRLHLLDNLDPRTVAQASEALDPKKTLIQVVSRDGRATEVLGLTAWAVDWLRRKGGKTAAQLVICTDRDKSPLAELARSDKCDLIHHPQHLPGRFAVLSASALFAAGLLGCDIAALLAGAAEMDKRCRHGDALKNPAYMHALVHYLLTRKRRKTMHAAYAFSDRLHAIAAWYVHLCTVSLGKMLNRKGKAVHVGPTPLAARGSYDLSVQQQLYAEGPYDKVVTFLIARQHGPSLQVPAVRLEGFPWLKEQSFEAILERSWIACEQQLTASGRPSMAIQLDAIDEHHIGGLVYMLELSTVMSAELYDINPFDAPGAEQAMQGVWAQSGAAGHEDLARRIREYRGRARRSC